MAEKRFTIESERINNTYSIHIWKDDEVIFEISNWDSLSSMHKKECEDIVDLLNEQHKQIQSQAIVIQGYQERCDKVFKENEQLKQELKDYHNAFDCSQCRYQNYDWFDDGDEFEVCDKGNNEAQMDNHSCIDWEEL